MNIEKAEAKSKLIEMSKQNIENKTKKELELKQKQEYNSQMGLIYNKIDDDHLIKIIEQINDKIYKKDPVIE
ncbi:hypothetical protein PFUGPA_01141, partial [Plasmodium falciparum Palo Alto/Uganda]